MPITLYKRGRFWWLTGDAKTRTGYQRIHESTGTADLEGAHQIRMLRERQFYNILILGDRVCFTFDQAVDLYLEAGKPDCFIPPLRQHFQAQRIAEMNGEMVRAAARKLYPDAAYTTWNRQVVTPARAIINHAADAGKCPPVKIKGFTRKDRTVRQPSTPPKRAVDRSYIDAFRQHSDDPRLSALMLFMFQTGCRIGDALKLEDDSADIDLINRKIIFRDMKNGEDGEADLTIEMVYEIQQLRERKRQRLEEWEKTGKFFWGRHRRKQADQGTGARKPNTRLFGFIGRHSVYKGIRLICEKAGLPYLGTHQPGRHSFATQMIVVNGVDIATTALKGRWKSKRLLLENYTHGDRRLDVTDRVFGGHGCSIHQPKLEASQ